MDPGGQIWYKPNHSDSSVKKLLLGPLMHHQQFSDGPSVATISGCTSISAPCISISISTAGKSNAMQKEFVITAEQQFCIGRRYQFYMWKILELYDHDQNKASRIRSHLYTKYFYLVFSDVVTSISPCFAVSFLNPKKPKY